MFHAPPPNNAADARPADPPAPARALVEAQVAALARLAEMGMQIAEAATRAAVAGLEGEADARDHRDPTLAFTRAARAVRMCFALQTRLLNELPALERAEEKVRYDLRHARKKQIVRLLEQVAETAHGDEIERISDEAWERLGDADEYGEVMNLPLGEAVARICKDLDVTPDWGLWGGGEISAGAEELSLPFMGRVDPEGGRVGNVLHTRLPPGCPTRRLRRHPPHEGEGAKPDPPGAANRIAGPAPPG